MTNDSDHSSEMTPDEWPAAERVNRIPMGTMVGTLLMLALFIGVLIVVLGDPFGAREVPTSLEKTPGQKVRELRAEQKSTLKTYGKATEKGKYRIPIDEAIKTMVDEAQENGNLSLPLPEKQEPETQAK